MQRLDFRVYDCQNKFIVNNAQNGYDIFYPQTNTSTNVPFETMINDRNYIIDLWIGIFDAKGIPIYRNDIVENMYNHKQFVVKYHDCAYVLQNIENKEELPSEYLSSFKNSLEVIGNVYQENK